jgi:hypothetical protein
VVADDVHRLGLMGSEPAEESLGLGQERRLVPLEAEEIVQSMTLDDQPTVRLGAHAGVGRDHVKEVDAPVSLDELVERPWEKLTRRCTKSPRRNK